MNVQGKKILVLGDSLSSGNSTPGGVLGAQLRAAGATVRVNGRVSRSAVNFWSGKNGEDGAAVIAAEAAQRPDIVIVMLGTNDMGMNAGADATAFRRITAAFGAELWAIGPPSFARADYTREAQTVYGTLAGVFGGARVIDWRPLSADQLVAPARSGDGVHFTSAGAAVAGQRLAMAVLAAGAPAYGTSAMPALRAWWPVPVSAAMAAAALVGVAWMVRRRNRLAGPRPGLDQKIAAAEAEVARLEAEYNDLIRENPYAVHFSSGERLLRAENAARKKLDRLYERRDAVGLGASGDALPARARDDVPGAIRSEIDDAVDRAVAAGAKAPLEYIGAGAEGIVFCDPTETAFKVGRPGRGSLATEAQFFKKASQVPSIKQHIAAFKRYDREHDVIVRECVRQRGERHGRPRRLDDAEAHDMAAKIREAMEPYGFTAPERKGDSYVWVSGRGPVLVDGGFVHERGHELVKRVLDVLNDRPAPRTWRPKAEIYEGLISDLEWERGKTVPAKIADRLITRLQAGITGS